MAGMICQPKPTARSQHLLEEIARTIGVPVSSFYSQEDRRTATDLAAFARLYTAITNAQGRQRVMNVARREAERCQGQQGAESSD